MEEEPTKQLPGASPFERQVLRELRALRSDIAALDTRLTALERGLTSLEEKVDARLRETRPIWEAVQLRLERMDMKLDKVIQDLYETRTDVGLLDKRLSVLEQPRPA